MQHSVNTDRKSLAEELKKTIRGEVRFDKGALSMYSTDSSNYRMVPVGVVLPKTKGDVIESIRIARKYDCPILSRGGGTSLAGQCCNTALIMEMSKYYHGILQIDPVKKTGTVLPGTVLDRFRKETKKYGLTFGPDPATHDHCTMGGMLGNNSCGVHSDLAVNQGTGARVSDNTVEMEIITYDGLIMKIGATTEDELEEIIAEGGRRGEIYLQLKNLRDKYAPLIRSRFPKIPRRVSGYNLDDLLPENDFNVARALVGTESTCVTILQSTMLLIDEPKAKSLLVLGYKNVFEAAHHAPELLKYKPDGLEGIDDKLVNLMRKRNLHVDELDLLPEGNGWLIAEFSGKTLEEADDKIAFVMSELKKTNHPASMKLFDKRSDESKIWDVRESGLGASAFIKGQEDTWEGWEDSAVPPEKLGDYLQDLQKLWDKYGYDSTMYGHFGQGCMHCRLNFDLVTKDGIKKWRDYLDEAADLVVSYGGSISGEHGDGQSKAELLEKMYGPELMEAFRSFKAIWDPTNKMNPGKIVNPYPITSHLRLGIDYEPWQPQTHFSFPDDQGSFARATMRCVGVGKCRRDEEGTMCPSYMVTFEEEHSTRGRAHMLFELFHGGILNQQWDNKYVKQALDLCLSCKGCKADCPVNVDMASYKAEFLSHYYKGRLRPRTAYTFGWIYWWARMASIFPGPVNFFTQTSPFSNLVKILAGISPKRTLPKFAVQTFRSWFNERKENRQSKILNRKSKVILWPDTFNNFFQPGILKAGHAVLQAAGYEVVIPKQMLCCGRPLYDYGMLKTAKKLLFQILDSLRHFIREGIPLVALEPSCVAVFRDELCNLLPQDEDAKRLKHQTFTLAEFLEKEAIHFPIPPLKQKAIVHGHCHHKAIMKIDPEINIMRRMELDFEFLDAGCCGMAGAFGYENGSHYEVSIKAGERILLPAVRNAGKDTLIIADGFSCRQQIEQQTDRKSLHLAQVLQMALIQTNSNDKNEKNEMEIDQ
jgi:FAD/FMN-containing dehydrogenase/Fe-S oxidoreductase